MLNIISMVTTKKMTIEYAKKETKEKFKHFTTKKKTKHKEGRNTGNDR